MSINWSPFFTSADCVPDTDGYESESSGFALEDCQDYEPDKDGSQEVPETESETQHLQKIFTKGNGLPLRVFFLSGSVIDINTLSQCGGVVVAPGQEYDLCLASPDLSVSFPDDVFSTNYIHSCVRKKVLLTRLEEFRLKKVSQFANPEVLADILKGTRDRSALIPKGAELSASGSRGGLVLSEGKVQTDNSELRQDVAQVPVRIKAFHAQAAGHSASKKDTANMNPRKYSSNSSSDSESDIRIIPSSKAKNSLHASSEDEVPPVSSTFAQGRPTVHQGSPTDSSGRLSPVPSISSLLNVNKRTRLPYTYTEQKKIVAYIARNRLYNEVKGTRIWKDMETEDLLPRRSWQSMKENFLKKIVKNLAAFDLSPEQRRNFELGMKHRFM